MFTGIVTDVGCVRTVEGEGDVRVSIQTTYDTKTIEIGASIACSGVCLTVVDKGQDWFSADVSRETLDVTNLKAWKKGLEINLERSLKVGDELGGHIVTGHVDCVAELVTFKRIDDSILLEITVPRSLGHNVAKKGSIAINGVSLTVNEVEDLTEVTKVSLNIIPHTHHVTSFRVAKVGDLLNIEFDILARYVARLQSKG